MDDDLHRIVSLPDELHKDTGSIYVDGELASPEKEVEEDICYEHFDEFHFAVAMFVIEEDEKAVELEFENGVSVMAGEKEFPCINSDKICKSKAGLTRHVNAKRGEKAHGKKEALSSSIATFTEKELASIVDKIKAKITKDGFWDSEIWDRKNKIRIKGITHKMAKCAQTCPTILFHSLQTVSTLCFQPLKNLNRAWCAMQYKFSVNLFICTYCTIMPYLSILYQSILSYNQSYQ